jgi:hypothetical protein
MSSWLNQIAPSYTAKGIKILNVVGKSFQGAGAASAAQCNQYKTAAGGLANVTPLRDTTSASSVYASLGFNTFYCYLAVDSAMRIRFSYCGGGGYVEGPGGQQRVTNMLNSM